jgi:hypothetical protein
VRPAHALSSAERVWAHSQIKWGLGTHHSLSMLLYLMSPNEYRRQRLVKELAEVRGYVCMRV